MSGSTSARRRSSIPGRSSSGVRSTIAPSSGSACTLWLPDGSSFDLRRSCVPRECYRVPTMIRAVRYWRMFRLSILFAAIFAISASSPGSFDDIFLQPRPTGLSLFPRHRMTCTRRLAEVEGIRHVVVLAYPLLAPSLSPGCSPSLILWLVPDPEWSCFIQADLEGVRRYRWPPSRRRCSPSSSMPCSALLLCGTTGEWPDDLLPDPPDLQPMGNRRSTQPSCSPSGS